MVANGAAPFLFLGADGKPAGLELEILEYLAKKQGRRLEVVWRDHFKDVMPTLSRGEADIGAARITVTPERAKSFDFSASYFPVRVQLVHRRGAAVAALGELVGRRVATIEGTTYHQLLAKEPGIKLVFAGNSRGTFALLAAGEVDALAVDSAVAFSLLGEFPGLELGIPLTDEEQIAFALAKGSPLTAPLNQVLRDLKDSGIYFRLLKKHLGAAAADVVRSGRDE